MRKKQWSQIKKSKTDESADGQMVKKVKSEDEWWENEKQLKKERLKNNIYVDFKQSSQALIENKNVERFKICTSIF